MVSFFRVNCSVVGRTPMTGMMEDPEDICAQRVGEVGDAVVEPVDDRGDGDDRGDADDDAQDGQSRAQLVRPQRIEGHLDGFAGLSLRHKAPGVLGVRD